MTRIRPARATMAFLCLLAAGCCTDLQASYVRAMEATRKAVEADVTAGLYKPDAASRRTLDGWKDSNAKAESALEDGGKGSAK